MGVLKMKKILGAAVLAAGVAMSTLPATASELWDPQLRGVNEGLPAGALPPPGVYGVLNTYWASYKWRNTTGAAESGKDLSALVVVPVVLWSTGYKILGADYAVAAALPFDYTSAGANLAGSTGGGNWGLYNALIVPGQLAWTFGDFHVKAGLSVYLDTASSTVADLVKGKNLRGGLPSGNGYTTIQPDLGFSWLKDGWNVSADLHFAVPIDSTKAPGYDYESGSQFSADYTVAKTFDKWTFGLGAHHQQQVEEDVLNGVKQKDSENINFGLGPIVGYQFGGVNIQATWNHYLYARHDVAGDFFNVRFLVPFNF